MLKVSATLLDGAPTLYLDLFKCFITSCLPASFLAAWTFTAPFAVSTLPFDLPDLLLLPSSSSSEIAIVFVFFNRTGAVTVGSGLTMGNSLAHSMTGQNLASLGTTVPHHIHFF